MFSLRFVLLFYVLSSVLVSMNAEAEFVPAKRIYKSQGLHPDLVRRSSRVSFSYDSGAVEVAYMVNKNGQVSDVRVLKSTQEKFEKHAIELVRNYTFDPAQLGSIPTSSIVRETIVFLLDRSKIANTNWFHSNEGNSQDDRVSGLLAVFHESVSDQDQAQAETVLVSMRNIRSRSFDRLVQMELAQLLFSEVFNEPQLRFDSLQTLHWLQGLKYEGKKDLDAQTRLVIRVNLLTELINRSRYVEAIELYESMSKEEQVIRKFASAVEEIQQIQKSADPIQQSVLISDSGDGHHRLFKRSFSVELESGNLDQIELRCDTKFTRIEFEPDKTYAVPKRWGDCLLSLLGAPGTKGTLLEQ